MVKEDLIVVKEGLVVVKAPLIRAGMEGGKAQGMLEEQRLWYKLGPTPQTLSRYIAYTSQFITSGPKYLSGARHFLKDLYPEWDEVRGDPLVQATICGSKKARADPVHRKLPFRPSHLDYYSPAVFTGAIVQGNGKSLFDWRKIIKRALVFVGKRAQYHLPYHKGDPFYRGTDILFTEQEIADPVSLLHQYVGKRDSCHGACTALFLREDGSIPTRSWFDKKFFALLSRDYGGHSPRAGAATFYASLGLSESFIASSIKPVSADVRGFSNGKVKIEARGTLRLPAQLPNGKIAYRVWTPGLETVPKVEPEEEQIWYSPEWPEGFRTDDEDAEEGEEEEGDESLPPIQVEEQPEESEGD
ncbi:hypothetical protein B0H10DRAFT_2222267 [Mycena sp. CBHHK59/15]|nr:hypothetical protein B0H10DRAFT_2222267 [Mycena sp. CBHHK59/15]